MKLGSTIIVLILAAASVVAMWRAGWSGSSGASRDRQTTSGATTRLLSSSPIPLNELMRITLKRTGEPTIVFQRHGPNWDQEQPFSHPMDPFSIRQLAQQALELDLIDVIAPAELGGGMSAASLSLQPPDAEIVYEWAKGSFALHLGRRSVAGRAFLRIGGEERICIVNQKLHERAIDMDPKEWRSRTIFPGAGIESSRFEWHNGRANMTLARERKQWIMVEPVRTRLDPAARDQFLDAIGRASVSGFILDQPTESDLANFALNDSPLNVTITNPSDVQKLIIGARAGGGTQDFFGIVEGRPTVVRIGGAVLAALFRQPQDLVAHTASGIVPADVKSIVIRHEDDADELRLERDLEKWKAASPSGSTDVNPAQVQELLDQLTTLRAVSVQFVDQYPRELEVATITLHGFDGKAIDTIRIIREKETQRWGMENGDSVIRWYPASLEMRLAAESFGMK